MAILQNTTITGTLNIIGTVSASSYTGGALAAGAIGPQGSVQFNNLGGVSGSSDLVWDIANSRLGVGTSAPIAKLNVVGTDGGGRGVQIDNGEIKIRGDGAKHYSLYNSGSIFSIRDTSVSASMGVTGTTIFSINNNNIGIGTSNPNFTLAVTGTLGVSGITTLLSNLSGTSATFQTTLRGNPIELTSSTGLLALRSDTDYVQLHIRPAAGKKGYISFTENAVADRWFVGIDNGEDALKFKDGTLTEKVRITAAGNVGIGTSSPSAKLSVSGGLVSFNTAQTIGMKGAGAVNDDLYNWAITPDGDTNWGFRLQNIVNNKYYTDVLYYGAFTGSNRGFRVIDKAGASETTRFIVDGDGNVGIGKDIPGAKLDIDGGIVIKNGNDISWGGVYGSGNPTIAGSSAGTSSFIAFYPQGNVSVEKARITAAGNVGIGTSNPISKLDVNSGENSTFAASIGSGISIGNWSGVHFGYREENSFYRKSGLVFERIDASARGKIHLLNNNDATSGSAGISDARLTILSSGEVGIGTTSPTHALQVSGAIAIKGTTNPDEPRLVFQANDNSARFTVETDLAAATTSDLLGFRSNNVDNILVLRGDGNVGIGTTTTLTEKFNLSGNLQMVGTNPRIFATFGGTAAPSYTFSTSESGSGFSSPSANSIVISTTSLERMRINSAGNVSIGNSSPGQLLDVRTSTATLGQGARIGEAVIGTWNGGSGTSYARFTNNSVASDPSSYALLQANNGETYLNSGPGRYLYLCTNGNSTVMTLTTTGEVGIGTTNPSAGNKLQVDGKVLFRPQGGNQSRFTFSGSSTSGYDGQFVIDDTALKIGATSDVRGIEFQTGATPTTKFAILPNGNVVLSGSISGMVSALTSSLTSYQLVAEDSGKFLHMSSSTAINLTVPAGLPSGFTVTLCQNGSGQITVVTGSGVVVRNRLGYTKTAGLYAVATLVSTGSNGYILAGETSV
jgi:hypothetical protein